MGGYISEIVLAALERFDEVGHGIAVFRLLDGRIAVGKLAHAVRENLVAVSLLERCDHRIHIFLQFFLIGSQSLLFTLLTATNSSEPVVGHHAKIC